MEYTYGRPNEMHKLAICEGCNKAVILGTLCFNWDCGECPNCCQCPQDDENEEMDDVEGRACSHCGTDRMWFDCGVCESCEDCCTCADVRQYDE